MLCKIHNREMRFHAKFGYSCPTPVSKSADGKTVLKWCDWKPGVVEVEGDSDIPFTDNEPQPEGKLMPTPDDLPGGDGPNWKEIGRVKAMCGMVNARLQTKTAPEVLLEIPHLRQLLKHIEAEAAKE